MALHLKMSCFFVEIIGVFGLKMPKTGKSAEILLNMGFLTNAGTKPATQNGYLRPANKRSYQNIFLFKEHNLYDTRINYEIR